MNDETLERLLLDRALGALDADVEALLAAHLAGDPAAARRAAAFNDAAALARQALPPGPRDAPPALSFGQLERIDRVRRQLVRIRTVGGMVAALVLGVGVGAWLTRTALSPLPSAPPPRIVQTPTGASHEAADDGAGLWSQRRWLAARANQQQDDRPARLIWESPFARPRIGDES
jgi:anti-sigma factor RsiW